jgi:hypothetical protein
MPNGRAQQWCSVGIRHLCKNIRNNKIMKYNNNKILIRYDNKKKMTLGWVVDGERRHAGQQGELVF